MAPLLSTLADVEASARELTVLRSHLRGCPPRFGASRTTGRVGAVSRGGESAEAASPGRSRPSGRPSPSRRAPRNRRGRDTGSSGARSPRGRSRRRHRRGTRTTSTPASVRTEPPALIGRTRRTFSAGRQEVWACAVWAGARGHVLRRRGHKRTNQPGSARHARRKRSRGNGRFCRQTGAARDLPCARLHLAVFHGKDGVIGSSPMEGLGRESEIRGVGGRGEVVGSSWGPRLAEEEASSRGMQSRAHGRGVAQLGDDVCVDEHRPNPLHGDGSERHDGALAGRARLALGREGVRVHAVPLHGTREDALASPGAGEPRTQDLRLHRTPPASGPGP